MSQIMICIIVQEYSRGLDPRSSDLEETIQNPEGVVGQIIETIGQGGEIQAAVTGSRIIDDGVIEDIELTSVGNLV